MDHLVRCNCSNNGRGYCIGHCSYFSMGCLGEKNCWSNYSCIIRTIRTRYKQWHRGFYGRDNIFCWKKYNVSNFRYLTAAVVLSINSRKRKTIERDIVKVIEQEEYAYNDPITEFILWYDTHIFDMFSNIYFLVCMSNLTLKRLKTIWLNVRRCWRTTSFSATIPRNSLRMLGKLFLKHSAEFISVSGASKIYS